VEATCLIRLLAHVAMDIALEAEMLVALFTVGGISTVIAECLVALVTDYHFFALGAEFLIAFFTVVTFLALTA
jgi:hypothetical protein